MKLRHRGPRYRGRCPVCGMTRRVRTWDPDSDVILDTPVMARHVVPIGTDVCAGVGQPPASVVTT